LTTSAEVLNTNKLLLLLPSWRRRRRSSTYSSRRITSCTCMSVNIHYSLYYYSLYCKLYSRSSTYSWCLMTSCTFTRTCARWQIGTMHVPSAMEALEEEVDLRLLQATAEGKMEDRPLGMP
jgi:hypothetical protein